MITREWLDRALPVGPETRLAAEAACGVMFERDTLPICLNWLAEATEADRFPEPEWKQFDPERGARFESAWPVSMGGLQYKSAGEYLTAEGWPLRTRCWFIVVECGWREIVAAEAPEWAAMRAAIVFAAARDWRDIDPKERPGFLTYVEQRVGAHNAHPVANAQ